MMRLAEWYDPPTFAGIRGSVLAVAIMFAALSHLSIADGRQKLERAELNNRYERQHIHLIFYRWGTGGEPLSNCLAHYRWMVNGENHVQYDKLWLENEECEIPTHPLDSWMPCDFTHYAYRQTENTIDSVTVMCGPGVEIILSRQVGA